MKDPVRALFLLLIVLLTCSALTGYPQIADSQLAEPIIQLVRLYLAIN